MHIAQLAMDYSPMLLVVDGVGSIPVEEIFFCFSIFQFV